MSSGDKENPNSVADTLAGGGSTYLFAAGIAGQIGCLLVLITGGAVVGGLLLDQALGTRPIFIFVLLLVSIPLNLLMIYRFTLHQSKRAAALQEQIRKQRALEAAGRAEDDAEA